MNQHQQNETVNFQQPTKNQKKKGKERREKEGKEKEWKRKWKGKREFEFY